MPVQTRGIHFFTVHPPAHAEPGAAMVNTGATVHPIAPVSVTPVTEPAVIVAIAVGRVVHVHPVTVTVGTDV